MTTPITLAHGVSLRLVEPGDGEALATALALNAEHLAPWDPVREPDHTTPVRQEAFVAEMRAQWSTNSAAAFVLVAGAEIIGQATVSHIVRGPFLSANLGYWLDAGWTGHGLMSAAVGAIADFSRDALGLHRLQAATLVHNGASQRVLERAGFERIGLAPRYLQIAGRWQDHVLFQRLLED
ncbi:GNAT family N-acetyltransferase [Demequina sp. NBRC 110055]|uniref:GNAT family N-acetyltransferase n=1 Tax=Demequina sp. NBRC 110055 TaxID=1570344 RepID=UPI000A05C0C9|nr:GNAT family N-acetyltransferase [Demequina sp. NBRC 110055]